MTDPTDSSHSDFGRWIRAGLILAGAVLLVWSLFWYGVYSWKLDWVKTGAWGDTFGALNTLFSGLAFGALLLTLLMQREELGLQREELTATRKELARGAESQEQAASLLRDQLNLQQGEHLNQLRSSLSQMYVAHAALKAKRGAQEHTQTVEAMLAQLEACIRELELSTSREQVERKTEAEPVR
ncbi:MAG: hypothetical protein AAFZ38_03750 [Myxococcota bacterium]